MSLKPEEIHALSSVASAHVTDARTVAETLGVVLAKSGAAPLDKMVELYIRATIEAYDGNQSAAARALKITRWRLRRILAREAA